MKPFTKPIGFVYLLLSIGNVHFIQSKLLNNNITELMLRFPRGHNWANISNPLDDYDLQYLIRGMQNLFCPNRYCETRTNDIKPIIAGRCAEYCDECLCREHCEKHGHCCPDAEYRPLTEDWTCMSSVVKKCTPSGQGFNSFNMFALRSCAVGYPDGDIKKKCESAPTDLYHIDDLLPVYRKPIVYRNKYCAICNGVLQYRIWPFSIYCTEVSKLPSSMTYEEAIDEVLQDWPCDIYMESVSQDLINDVAFCHDNTVNLKYSTDATVETTTIPQSGDRQPDTDRNLNIKQTTCTSDMQDDSIISECNVTGYWIEYNKNIEQACRLYTLTFAKRYQNVFCFLCNAENIYPVCQWKPYRGPDNIFVDFANILKFSSGVTVIGTKRECQRGFQFDKLSGKCIEIFCPDGEWYNEGKCITIAQRYCVDTFNTVVVYKIKPMVQIACDRDLTALLSMSQQLESIFRGKHPYLNDETPIISYALSQVDVSQLKLLDDCFPNATENIYGFLLNVSEPCQYRHLESTPDLFQHINGNISMLQSPPIYFEYDSHISSPEHNNISFLIDNQTVDHLRPFFTKAHAFDRIEFCPFVSLHDSEYFVINENGVLLTGLGKRIPIGEFSAINFTTIRVCSDVFFAAQANYTDGEANSFIISRRGILSFVCSSCSIICLALTFAVYCLLKSLRTIPGLNNMLLAITLMLAQTLYQFGAGQTSNQTVCKIVGVAIHYIWLAAVFCMNVCCFHMFRVFGFLGTSLAVDRKGNGTFLRYVTYCFCTPVIIICVNITISLTLPGMNDVGYGGVICFISHPLLLGLTFALVVGMVVICNTVFFCVVAVSIKRQSSFSALAAGNKRYLNVYFKLSTLTGVTWVFGFVYQWSGLEIFSYLFIVLNASQGVFLFLAFVFNRTVYLKLKLLAQNGWKNPPTTTYSHSVRLSHM